MARWIALGITLLLMGSCSFISTDVFRGVIAPLGAAVMCFVTLFLFVQDRVSSRVRPPTALLLDAETQRLMRQRAERNKAAAQASGDRSQAGPGAASGDHS
ncbi:MAG: hypothetical protein AB7E72_17415 [Lysobacterales bacterium]